MCPAPMRSGVHQISFPTTRSLGCLPHGATTTGKSPKSEFFFCFTIRLASDVGRVKHQLKIWCYSGVPNTR